jgi:outer membrane protein assembly factor BamB
MRDVLACLNAKDGTQIWRRDFPKEMNRPLPNFGFVSSPLVDGDYVYVQAGGAFLKLEKATGKTVWQSLDDGGGMNGSAFSSPTIATLAGKRQAVVLTRKTLNGVDLETGSTLWSQEIPAFRGMNIVTPTIFDGGVFLSTYGGTSQFFKVEKDGGSYSITESWKAPLQGYMCSPVVVGNYAYLHLRNQRFACFDLRSGEVKWRSKPYGKYASLVVAGDQIMALCDDGDMMLIKANPEKFEVVDTRPVADNSWAHLAVNKERLFVRDLKALKIFKWK